MTVGERVSKHCDYNRISIGRRALMLRTLQLFESEHGPLEQIDAAQFQSYMSDLLSSGLHVNTVRKLGNVLRMYVRQMWLDGEISADTYLRIKETKNPRGASGRTTPKPYTREQIKTLYTMIDAALPIPSQITIGRWHQGTAGYPKIYPLLANLQTKAIVALALDCGMRRNEIYRATVQDIHPDNEYVVVRMGKSKIDGEPRYREVPWTAHATEAVKAWLEVRAWLNPLHESPWLVLSPQASQNGRIPSSPELPMAKDAFGALLGKVGPTPYHLHRLRHTCATFKLRAGMTIEVLSRFLGHSTIQQTLCYAELNRTDIRRQSERTEADFDELIGERT